MDRTGETARRNVDRRARAARMLELLEAIAEDAAQPAPARVAAATGAHDRLVGKPVETHLHLDAEDVSAMTDEQLAAERAELQRQIARSGGAGAADPAGDAPEALPG